MEHRKKITNFWHTILTASAISSQALGTYGSLVNNSGFTSVVPGSLAYRLQHAISAGSRDLTRSPSTLYSPKAGGTGVILANDESHGWPNSSPVLFGYGPRYQPRTSRQCSRMLVGNCLSWPPAVIALRVAFPVILARAWLSSWYGLVSGALVGVNYGRTFLNLSLCLCQVCPQCPPCNVNVEEAGCRIALALSCP